MAREKRGDLVCNWALRAVSLRVEDKTREVGRAMRKGMKPEKSRNYRDAARIIACLIFCPRGVIFSPRNGKWMFWRRHRRLSERHFQRCKQFNIAGLEFLFCDEAAGAQSLYGHIGLNTCRALSVRIVIRLA